MCVLYTSGTITIYYASLLMYTNTDIYGTAASVTIAFGGKSFIFGIDKNRLCVCAVAVDDVIVDFIG